MVAVLKRSKREKKTEETSSNVATKSMGAMEIPAGDLLESYLISMAAPVDVQSLELDSPALDELRTEGVEVIVPLVGQGELLGALYLGSRLSDQPYSKDDRKLLASLASQVAPAMQVAQLVREQQAEAKERERIQQELQVAALIQHTLLPRELPRKAGWVVDAFYRPARSVGGDFYDFIDLPDGKLGVAIGDVTDKGVPAALVMATCRSMLRSAAVRHESPRAVLVDVNETLVDEIPPAMFVTCLYAILDLDTGSMTLANAGHNLPYVRTESGVIELRATGMPLGLMPGMDYEEKDYTFSMGDLMVLTSDGITEAHSPEGEMYGFGRLMGQVATPAPDKDMVSALVADVESHTGSDAEQEDDITLVVVRRQEGGSDSSTDDSETQRRELIEFSLPSVEGNERIAIEKVAEVLGSVDLGAAQVERLKTAVGETVMNAMEHGNGFDPEQEVTVRVEAVTDTLFVQVTDNGSSDPDEAPTPDLEAKLAGDQSPRGWGLFLIGEMVDEVTSHNGDGRHTVELVMKVKGADE